MDSEDRNDTDAKRVEVSRENLSHQSRYEKKLGRSFHKQDSPGEEKSPASCIEIALQILNLTLRKKALGVEGNGGNRWRSSVGKENGGGKWGA